MYCVGGEKDIGTHATTAYVEKFTIKVQDNNELPVREGLLEFPE